MKRFFIYFFLPILIGVLIIPNIILIYTTLSGQGTTYQSLRATYQTKRFWDYTIKGQANKAISYISFTGLDENKQYLGKSQVAAERNRLKAYLNSLDKMPAELIFVQDIKITSNDSYVSGRFDLWFRQGDKKLVVIGTMKEQEDKIAIQSSYKIKENKDSIDTDWLDGFFHNISTYYSR